MIHVAVNEDWKHARDIMHKAASERVGFIISKHKDWFNTLKPLYCFKHLGIKVAQTRRHKI